MRIFKYILLIILVYIYFFDPFYIPNIGLFGRSEDQFSIFLLYILSLFAFFIYRREASLFLRQFRTEFIYMMLIVISSLLITLAGGSSIIFAGHVKWFISSFFVPFFFITYSKNLGIINEKGITKVVLITGLVASAGTLICILYPSISNLYKHSVINLENTSFLMEGFRGFGFSTRLTNDFGFIQGALFAIGLYYGKEYGWFYYGAIFVLLSSFLNARTGVVLAMLGVLIMIAYNNSKKKTILVVLLSTILGVYVVQNHETLSYAIGLDNKAANWIDEFFIDMETLFQTGDVSNTRVGETLFSEMILWPETLSGWLFGIGESVFKVGFHSGGHSDIGFIIQLNYGGIFYFAILMMFMIKLAIRLWKSNFKYISIFFVVSFLILNTKSNFALRQGGALGLYLIIYYFFIYGTFIKQKKRLSSESNEKNISYFK